MPYNPGTQSSILISKKHHAMLKKLAGQQRRTIQGMVEILIEEAASVPNPIRISDAKGTGFYAPMDIAPGEYPVEDSKLFNVVISMTGQVVTGGEKLSKDEAEALMTKHNLNGDMSLVEYRGHGK